MHHQNLEKLKRLRLFGMARALEDLQNLADRGQLDFADQLGHDDRPRSGGSRQCRHADPAEAGSPAPGRLL